MCSPNKGFIVFSFLDSVYYGSFYCMILFVSRRH